MHYLFPLATAASLLFGAATAGAQIVSVGSSPAAACYQAAASHRADRAAIDVCNLAFTSSASARDLVATHVNRGIIHRFRGDDASALRDFEAAMRLDPNEPEAYLNKGLLLLRMEGRDSDVISLADTALAKRTRKPALAYFARAMANEGLGNVSAAYNDYQRAAALDPKWQLPAAELQRFSTRG